jgi:hypothetical protein
VEKSGGGVCHWSRGSWGYGPTLYGGPLWYHSPLSSTAILAVVSLTYSSLALKIVRPTETLVEEWWTRPSLAPRLAQCARGTSRLTPFTAGFAPSAPSTMRALKVVVLASATLAAARVLSREVNVLVSNPRSSGSPANARFSFATVSGDAGPAGPG